MRLLKFYALFSADSYHQIRHRIVVYTFQSHDC